LGGEQKKNKLFKSYQNSGSKVAFEEIDENLGEEVKENQN
jgi:hypothetical protein